MSTGHTWVHTADVPSHLMVEAAKARAWVLLLDVRLAVLMHWPGRRGSMAKVVLIGPAGGTWHLVVPAIQVTHVAVAVTAVAP